MNSYDVFDTIIGRLCYTGHNIFQILENEYNIIDFKKNRIFYESLTKNFDKTYQELQNYYKKDLSHIKQREIELEYELSFPIVKYLNKIKKKDILISDMYLAENTIKNMINKHKCIDNNLFVTYGGKSNNTIWKNKNTVSNINTHYGDNFISDFKNPLQHNINAFHIKDTKLNNIETIISSINNYISHVLRATRLSYISDDILFEPFINFALPFIIIVCLKIKQISAYNNLNSIVFLSRDGYWFKEIYDIMYPMDNTEYIYFSRLYVKNNKDVIINQINNISGNKFIFDLQGSGKTFHSLNLQNCFYFMVFLSHDSQLPNYLYKHSANISNIKQIIEDLFIAPHGSVRSYNKSTRQIDLLEPEHDIKLFQPYFKGIQLFKQHWNTMQKYFTFEINYNNLDYVINNFHNNIEYQITLKNKINSIIKHVNTHTDSYDKNPLQFYSQIEQDKYYIENIIKYKQNGVFLEIGGYDGVTGSNTYFLEKHLGWNGIIVECNPTLVEKCKNTRSCYICDKALYETDDVEITFTIPVGDEIIGGKEQLGGIKSLLKPESLKAFQRCYKESKDITVKTININTLLEGRKIYNIDYVSLDVEGGEVSILKTWDFNKHKVKFLTVEHGNISHYQKSINTLLTSKGFSLHRNNKWDDEYIYI
uniref:Methyltransferase FkbM domain-containing protein n=1 Tax=viral metagenome TaxID=1070528 RepID=A0A6C0C662_9ZZZZ